jgi:hypothetical protein
MQTAQASGASNALLAELSFSYLEVCLFCSPHRNEKRIRAIVALVCSTAPADPEQVTCDSPCDFPMPTARAGGQSKPIRRFRRQTERNSRGHTIRNVQLARPGRGFNDAIRAHRNRKQMVALTGRVVELKLEEDGDLHIALHDVTGDKPGVVVCEIPAQPHWGEIRTTVFSWPAVSM